MTEARRATKDSRICTEAAWYSEPSGHVQLPPASPVPLALVVTTLTRGPLHTATSVGSLVEAALVPVGAAVGAAVAFGAGIGAFEGYEKAV